jgi:hypothetical protein
MSETTTKQATAPGVVVSDSPSQALQRLPTGWMAPAAADAPPLAALAMLEGAMAVAKRMAEMVEGVRRAAITMTDPVDWVLNKDKQGAEVAMLTASGAQKVASLYGIGLQPLAGQADLTPEKTQINDKDAYTLRAIAFSRFLGREIEIEATRRTDEEFTGRETDDGGEFKFKGGTSFEPDLRKSTRTLAMTTAVRELVGLKNVSRRELDSCWVGAAKDTKGCRFGHGYGTSTDRSAAGVAEGDVGAKAEALRIDILQRVSGDEGAAKKVLGEITVDKDGKFAKTSTKQFTQGWQVEKAVERLAKHPIFGDQRRERAPGEE